MSTISSETMFRLSRKMNWRFLRNIGFLCSLALFFLWDTVCLAQDGYTVKEPKIAYWILEGKGPIVIVVHGGPGVAHDYLKPEWTELARYGVVVFYDQRGVGKSQTAQCYSWHEQVLDLYRLIECISPAKKVILAGSSWGVDLSLLFAHYYPEKVQGLILSGITNWKGRGLPPKDCSQFKDSAIVSQSIIAKLEKDIIKLQSDMPVYDGANRKVIHTSAEEVFMKKKEIVEYELVKDWTLNSLEDAPTFGHCLNKCVSVASK